jgi:hypothetical protein
VLLPVYAALAAAFAFYLLIPVLGGFLLRSQWRRFRKRIAAAATLPSLRYRDVALALREGRTELGSFRMIGTVEALEGNDRVWVRGGGISALVDLSRAPLYVLAPGAMAAGAIQRLPWASVSSLVEGTEMLVAGALALEGNKQVFVDRAEEPLIAVCYEGGRAHLMSRLVASGRSPNEYWNNPTRLSLAVGLATIAALLLSFGSSSFPSVLALVFLAGALPILPFAPPGLALFFLYLRLWRRALAFRVERDLLRLPLGYESTPTGAALRYVRRKLAPGELPPAGATAIEPAAPRAPDRMAGTLTVFEPASGEAAEEEVFAIEGEPEARARAAERAAAVYIAAAGLSLVLAIAINFALAFLVWRSTL